MNGVASEAVMDEPEAVQDPKPVKKAAVKKVADAGPKD